MFDFSVKKYLLNVIKTFYFYFLHTLLKKMNVGN